MMLLFYAFQLTTIIPYTCTIILLRRDASRYQIKYFRKKLERAFRINMWRDEDHMVEEQQSHGHSI